MISRLRAARLWPNTIRNHNPHNIIRRHRRLTRRRVTRLPRVTRERELTQVARLTLAGLGTSLDPAGLVPEEPGTAADLDTWADRFTAPGLPASHRRRRVAGTTSAG